LSRAWNVSERAVSKTLLKNTVLWDRPPLGSAGVPNLFGVSPQQRWFAGEKALNKLRTPTGDTFFNRVIETMRLGKTRSLGFDTLSADFILSLSKGYELLNQRSLVRDYPKSFWEVPLGLDA
jgi:hypothetical protein